ncbi:MAG: hypothetical protein ACRDT4_14350, partial [Micromonosporaceae bacterium]
MVAALWLLFGEEPRQLPSGIVNPMAYLPHLAAGAAAIGLVPAVLAVFRRPLITADSYSLTLRPGIGRTLVLPWASISDVAVYKVALQDDPEPLLLIRCVERHGKLGDTPTWWDQSVLRKAAKAAGGAIGGYDVAVKFAEFHGDYQQHLAAIGEFAPERVTVVDRTVSGKSSEAKSRPPRSGSAASGSPAVGSPAVGPPAGVPPVSGSPPAASPVSGAPDSAAAGSAVPPPSESYQPDRYDAGHYQQGPYEPESYGSTGYRSDGGYEPGGRGPDLHGQNRRGPERGQDRVAAGPAPSGQEPDADAAWFQSLRADAAEPADWDTPASPDWGAPASRNGERGPEPRDWDSGGPARSPEHPPVGRSAYRPAAAESAGSEPGPADPGPVAGRASVSRTYGTASVPPGAGRAPAPPPA